MKATCTCGKPFDTVSALIWHRHAQKEPLRHLIVNIEREEKLTDA